MTQQQAQRADFGPSWPKVAGFGEGTSQQAVFGVFPQGKISKTCKCLDTCPACRLAGRLKLLLKLALDKTKSTLYTQH